MSVAGHSYSIYNAVYIVAHALQAIYSTRMKHRIMLRYKRFELQDPQPWQVVPISVCNDYCHPGNQKKRKEEGKFCCYDCVPCPEGKISNQSGGAYFCVQ
ncbi:vomeronasal type-2 receptor 26-like [Podarcis lilfordi]|uniref:Vomeronasal type-2 receptor 26-like n=1 Tax=Podarcis lilfordi TaxID=74358 RepID=A0AA35L8T9_9SAUR|nr:vomeronasal type-2 receptor 26-like [Podarcis lilfordi]CAI5791309.1 vomeronasal type-2 receptor 26-like [Podarcis lilfordi]